MTTERIEAAEPLFGVRYTDAERAMMVETAAAGLRLNLLRRAVALPDDLPPATRFDPRLPGWRAPPAEAMRPAEVTAPLLPDDEDGIAFAPVTWLGAWLRAGALSSARLTRLYLDRIARHDPALACFATVTPDLALAQAAQADAALAAERWLGPLHGIPYGCKDIIDTAGILTAWGAEPYLDRVPATDATVVSRLASAGAVLLGKTSVGALAYGDRWYGGRTRNPWNTEQGSSGSSAGSASAVAAGLAGFALGTETLGSIVMPSERCGVTGLRPTYGRVPRTGAMALCWTLDKIGPICRGVADTALVLDALGGGDGVDPACIDLPFGVDAGRGVAGLRVGYFEADLAGEGSHPLDRAALEATRALGVEMVALDRADLPYAALVNLLDAEAAASFERLTLDDRDDLLAWQAPEAWPNGFRAARLLSAIDHIQLDRLRRLVMREAAGWFDRVDAIVGPVAVGPMLVITNFTGHPCLVLRSGLRDARTPHAACLWGRLFDEGTILRLGVALEAALGVAGLRPPDIIGE